MLEFFLSVRPIWLPIPRTLYVMFLCLAYKEAKSIYLLVAVYVVLLYYSISELNMTSVLFCKCFAAFIFN